MDLQIIDTQFQGMSQVTAVYLLVGPEGPVLIETGPGSTLPAVLHGLAKHGYSPADIRHVLVTHIHLDHAGAAGWWAQQGAQIYVHHLGGPHLVDPRRLIQSATRIYGEMMDTLWGEIVPAPADRVTTLYDGDTVSAGGLIFTALDTPGHANHHHSYLLETPDGRIAFTGDAAGVRLPHVGVVDLPAPPPEFDMEVWLTTLDKLGAAGADTFYLTHFGRVDGYQGHLDTLRELMIDSVAFLTRRLGDLTGWSPGKPFPEAIDPAVKTELLNNYIERNRGRASGLDLSPPAARSYELANPLFMSVDGILRYLKKKSQI